VKSLHSGNLPGPWIALPATYFNQLTFRAGEIAKICAKVEEDFLPRFEGNERSELEVKRRVAERKLTLLLDKDFAAKEIEPNISSLYDLGFADLERRATFELALSDYYLGNKLRDKAQPILKALSRELTQALGAEDSVLYREFECRVKALLSRT
jgi:hypothetical protein